MEETAETIKKYNRFAAVYDIIDWFQETFLNVKWRRQFISNLEGKILEIGIGTGKSMQFYNENAIVTGIDFSGKMLLKAKKRLAKSGRKNITLQEADVQKLPFGNNTFDYVVTFCVFCTVPDPVKGLEEVRRVLKPTGKMIMVEHVLSKNPFIAFIERIHDPFMKFLTGTSITRDTKQNILKAGLKIVKDKRLALYDVFRLFVSEK